MNLVALLIAPAIVTMSVGDHANTTMRLLIALGAVLIIAASVLVSKRRSVVVGGTANETSGALSTSAP